MSSAAAHSHSHSNANSSSASVADEFEWIHCNACYCDLWTASASAESTTGTNNNTPGLARFAVAHCTHILCASCLSQASNPAAPGLIQCPICHQIVHYNPLTSPDGSAINPDLAQFFSPLLPQWSQLLSATEFRQRNIDSLIRFLKDKLHLQRQGIERAAKELKSMRQLQVQYQAVVEENQALRMQLEHYLQQQQHQQRQPAPPPPQPMRAPAAPPSRQPPPTPAPSFQRSHTITTAASLQRPPPTSTTRTSTHLSASHQRSFSRAPSVQPQRAASRPPQAPSTRSGGASGGSRLSLSRATTGHAITPSKSTASRSAPVSPSGATAVSFSSGARMSTGQEFGAGNLRRAASTMTAVSGRGGGGSRGVRELRSQLRRR